MTCERKKNLLRSSFLYLTPQLQMESIHHRLPRTTFVLLMYITGKSNNPAINYWWSFPAVFVALLFQWCRQLPCEDCACIAKKHLLNIGRRYISNSTVLMLGLSLSLSLQYHSESISTAAFYIDRLLLLLLGNTRRKCTRMDIDPLDWLSYIHILVLYIYIPSVVFSMLCHTWLNMESNSTYFFRFVRLFPLGGQKNSTNVPKSIDWSIV